MILSYGRRYVLNFQHGLMTLENFDFDDDWLCELNSGLVMPTFIFVEFYHKYCSMTLWRYGEYVRIAARLWTRIRFRMSEFLFKIEIYT